MGYEILNKSLETMQHENNLHYVVKRVSEQSTF